MKSCFRTYTRRTPIFFRSAAWCGFFPLAPAREMNNLCRSTFPKRQKYLCRRFLHCHLCVFAPVFHRVSYERHNPLIEYLKKETGLPIKQIFPDTFDEHMKMVGQGKLDISFSNPVAYVKMAHRYGTSAFARIIEETEEQNSEARSSAGETTLRFKPLKTARASGGLPWTPPLPGIHVSSRALP